MLAARGSSRREVHMRAFVAEIFACFILASSLVVTAVEAQTPTETPAASPSPTVSPSPATTPTPFSGPQSTITIRFVRGGQPVTVQLAQAIDKLLADGQPCGVGTLAVVVDSAGHSTTWPLSGGDQPAP